MEHVIEPGDKIERALSAKIAANDFFNLADAKVGESRRQATAVSGAALKERKAAWPILASSPPS